MTPRHILTIASGTVDDVGALGLAADLAKRFKSAVTVMPAYQDAAWERIEIGKALSSPLPKDAVEDLRRADTQKQAEIERAAKDAAARAGLVVDGASHGSMTIDEREPQPWKAWAEKLTLADLVIVGAGAASGQGLGASLFSEALMDAQAPVLLATRSERRIQGGVAAIAWDGGSRSGRAVRAALPILAEADRIVILQDPSRLEHAISIPGADPKRLVQYLSLHDIGEVVVCEVSGTSVAQAILAEAKRNEACVLVAGAYGKPRWRQMIWGGATDTFVSDETRPHLFLSH